METENNHVESRDFIDKMASAIVAEEAAEHSGNDFKKFTESLSAEEKQELCEYLMDGEDVTEDDGQDKENEDSVDETGEEEK